MVTYKGISREPEVAGKSVGKMQISSSVFPEDFKSKSAEKMQISSSVRILK
jgi:hypothetical protein